MRPRGAPGFAVCAACAGCLVVAAAILIRLGDQAEVRTLVAVVGLAVILAVATIAPFVAEAGERAGLVQLGHGRGGNDG